jgi:hypothetical protein
MYIAKKKINGHLHYFIRQTYHSEGKLKNRTLFNLGVAPEKYIIYPGGNAYYIDEKIELSIDEMGIEIDAFELQDLFIPFLEHRFKRFIKTTSTMTRKSAKLSSAKCREEQLAIHIFDKRRYHFLRYGIINQGDIDGIAYRCFRKLLNKSRDEIECLIESEEERCLKTGEYKYYVYTIFNLQRFFSNHNMSKRAPYALNQDEVDDYLLNEICQLNKDKNFYEEHVPEKGLNEYLVKYLIMYFDNHYSSLASSNQSIHEFFYQQYQQYRQSKTASSSAMSLESSFFVFEINEAQYRDMTKEQLTRLFRRLAHKCHPDKGGEHNQFLCICEAYQKLLEGKEGTHKR